MAKRSKYVNGSKRIKFRKLGSYRWGVVDTWDKDGRTHAPRVVARIEKSSYPKDRPFAITPVALRDRFMTRPRTKWLYEARELAMRWAEAVYPDDVYGDDGKILYRVGNVGGLLVDRSNQVEVKAVSDE
jgi:hypothetical protein